MKFPCCRHPEEESVLVSGRSYCQECSRALDREIIVEWAHHAKPEITREKAQVILEEAFQTKDFGFSTFPSLYKILPRKMHKKISKGSFGFFLTQKDYLQQAFLKFIEDENASNP